MNDKVVDQVLILGLMMGLGIILRKRGIFSDPVRKAMGDMLINVTMPLMVIGAFNFKRSPEMLKNAGAVFVAALVIHVVLIIVSRLFYARFDKDKQAIFRFATVFSNAGFVGLPVVQGLYGSLGLFYASIFQIPFNILMWSWGIMLFTGDHKISSTLRVLVRNIPLLAIFLGLFLFLCEIHLPYPLQKTCESVGGMTPPLSMFIIGSMLADIHPRDVFRGFDVYYLSVIKLIVAPVACYFGLNAFHADHLLTSVCVVLIAMPTASIIGVFAERYNADPDTASRCAFLTTILSLLTLPCILSRI